MGGLPLLKAVLMTLPINVEYDIVELSPYFAKMRYRKSRADCCAA